MTDEIKIFVLEDDHEQREMIEDKLVEKKLYPHFLYSQSSELLPMLSGGPCVLALDFYLAGENLIDGNIIRRVKDVCEDCYTIIMSGQDSKNNFIQLLKANANDYVEKTADAQWLDELAKAIEEGRRAVAKSIQGKQLIQARENERKEIEKELMEVRRKLNESIKKRTVRNDR